LSLTQAINRDRRLDAAEIVLLWLAPSEPHAERDSANHYNDANERRTGRVVSISNVDANSADRYTGDYETDSHG